MFAIYVTPAGHSVLLLLIVASIPAVITAVYQNGIGTGKNSEANFYLDGMQQGYIEKFNDVQVVPFLVSKDGFQLRKRAEKKQCHILVQKTELQQGTCTTLANHTPACHNDQYLAINLNEC
ncbi:uncharacterized protein LOC129975054 [Argiope bruennichi]|uniref:Uncharacterized protein n=1 Tax=Argiope bruennichi TaxID=94029 RepID=A0A8T0ERD5_ARGBR|nr:uncharacterized protein LOC129975054 [Argiope bruennichi]KAF8778297.1 hypothetical protein HNY73_015031 [Argiope bruennichi]